MVDEFGIDNAIRLLKSGKRLSRLGWNGKHQWVEVQWPTEKSKMSLPYIYIRTVNGEMVPWLASQTDLLAEDWVVCEADG